VPADTISASIDRALDAYATLAELGETIDDEWSYIQDLTDAWQTRLEHVSATRGEKPASEAIETAVDRAIDEITRISDPHRAIDWLSTFPQIILVALGERP
jgi:hypothetical protein